MTWYRVASVVAVLIIVLWVVGLGYVVWQVTT